MLDQFLAVLAYMLRLYFRVGLLRSLRSLLLFDPGAVGSRSLTSYLLVCVFCLPSSTSVSTTLVSRLPFAFQLKVCRLFLAFCCETLSWMLGDYATSMELAFEWVFIVAGRC